MESEPSSNVAMLILESAVVGVLLIYFSQMLSDRKYKLPPGPRPWPLVGNLVHLSPLVHQGFAKMAEKYGDLVYLRLGMQHAFVVSSPQRAEEVFKTNDRILAGRSDAAFMELAVYDHQSMISASYGPHWRNVRKIATVQVLTAKRIQSYHNLRKVYMLRSLNTMFSACKDGKAIRIDGQMYELQTHNITGMTLGDKFLGQDSVASALRAGSQLMDITMQLGHLGTCFVVGDYFPLLRNFDFFGYKKRIVEVAKKSDDIMENILSEHEAKKLKTSIANADKETEDFVDVLLAESGPDKEQPLTRFQMRALLQDILLGGVETTSTTLSWALSELLKNPSTLKRAQEELDTVVGRDRLVKESDIPSLPYLRAVVKETLRIHPPLPLLLPHVALEDCTLKDGYTIPKNSTVFVNGWLLGRDPTLWENPLEFNPGRFFAEGKNVDHNGQLLKYLPFGAGRRNCPGKYLAETVVEYALASMLHACDWTLPQGVGTADLSMEERTGLTCPRAIPLEAVASPRLPLSVIFGESN